MKSQDILKLIESGESETLEFKSRLPSDHIIARVLSAFANTKGGILLIGVSDDGNITGLSKAAALLAKIKLQEICSSLFPFSVEIDGISVAGKNIVYVKVEKVSEGIFPILTSRGEMYQRTFSHEIAHSILHRPDLHIEAKKRVVVFIAMSFREEEEPSLVDYFRAMERAAKETKLPIDLVRIDLVEGDYEISQKIMDEINKADIVIADFTVNSRNVYFELGYARGISRRIIQTARKDTPLEFDIRNWRTVIYRNATELEEKLIPAFREAYAEVIK